MPITLTLPYPISAPGVYRIFDTESSRFYIGSSINVAKRWAQHRGRLTRGDHPNPMLQAIWRIKPDRLRIELIELCAADAVALLAAEQRALDAAMVGVNRNCMNVLTVAGSHLGRKRTEETKRRMSAAQLGKKASAETRQKLREAKLGRPQSVAVREAQSRRQLGKKLGPRGHNTVMRSDRFLTDDQVRALRQRRTEGASWRLLEIEFGLNKSAVKRCALGITYRVVT